MSLLPIARHRGRHRAADEVTRLRYELEKAQSLAADLQYRLAIATAGWDNANAKVSRLRDEVTRAAEATRQNVTAVSSLTAHPAVTETQPIPVLPLHLSPLAGNTSPSHIPGP
ncbi:hypothetical protein [Streptomyces sp. ISL-94]|uniref:hypothetical protein n=1 Tax=Streptomyces sp. ISL-94 TaxID=2819190 RepID=UPI001BE612F5|nr:hypothetical protein [Streptomyces sp. ISL-94]MBT2477589.1 hypothetical protein [Streptomyces sp. ISL-94]